MKLIKVNAMKKMIYCIFLNLIFLSKGYSQSLDKNQYRRALILQAFNQQPDKIIEPLKLEQIHLGLRDGRVDVNTKTKFSYFIHIAEMNNQHSEMVLIPMATSRYTPTYYQTDEWWDQHKSEIEMAKKNGTPMPKQDMNEVAAWLSQMKLSTNPDVIFINGETGLNRRQPLQDFLLDHYLKNYSQNGIITLYRGAEKVGEIESWNRKEVPRGVRYWTPNATYAWRYGRKNLNFLTDMVNNVTPLFKFEIPEKQFKEMVQRKWSQLTLGTELTKNAHQSFEYQNQFIDHLTGQVYPGEGAYGVEFEIRSNRAGAADMVNYYKGPATIDDLASDRMAVLSRTLNRLVKQNPEQQDELSQQFKARLKNIELEAEIIKAVLRGEEKVALNKLLTKFDSSKAEIVDIDGLDFKKWAINQAEIRRAQMVQQVGSDRSNKVLSCGGLF